MKAIVYSFFIILAYSCIRNPETVNEQVVPLSLSEITGHVIADTIIYDVLIKAANPDDEWENQRLRNLNHRAFIDSIFNLVYNKDIIAYDVFENKALSVSEVRSIENHNDYTRDRIGKIQFTERWNFDPSNQELQKQVISIALGYETYAEDGEVRAYKPIFKIYLK